MAGDPAAAREMFAELVPMLEWVFGLEHLHTLTTRHSLARWPGEAGDAAAAQNLLAELLPVLRRVSDPIRRARNEPGCQGQIVGGDH